MKSLDDPIFHKGAIVPPRSKAYTAVGMLTDSIMEVLEEFKILSKGDSEEKKLVKVKLRYRVKAMLKKFEV
jgi:hypothetical protein